MEEQSKVIESSRGTILRERKSFQRVKELECYSAQIVELSAVRGETAALQQNVAELLQEEKYLIVAQESWITECYGGRDAYVKGAV